MPQGKTVNWDLYTEVEDLAINLENFFSKIGPPDPVTGCRFQIAGGRHRQGYMLFNAHYRDSIGELQPRTNKMVTGHRILARLRYKRPIDPRDKVWHTCGNPRCLQQDHIELGDMMAVNTNTRKFHPKKPK